MQDDLAQALILIVDDDETNRQLLHARLSHYGFSNLVLSKDGQAALDFLEAGMPDLLLMDVMMPGMDGYEVTRRIREKYPEETLPIILVSALQTPEKRAQGIDIGANDFLSRPIDVIELISRIQSQLLIKQTRDKLRAEREQIEKLYQIGQLLSKQLDASALVAGIVELTTSLLGASKTLFILLHDQKGFQEKPLVRSGKVADLSGLATQLLDDEALKWLEINQKPLLIPDVTNLPRWQAAPEQEPVGCAAVAPLSYNGLMIGILLVATEQPNAFTEEHLNLLAAISNHAAIALKNTQLYLEAHQQKARSEAIINSTGSPVIVTNSDNIITDINQAARSSLFLTDDSLGKELSEVFSLKLADLVIRARERQSPVSGEHTIRQELGGEGVSYNVSVSPVENVGFILVWQDISALKEGERIRLASERVERQRVIETFSRYMSSALVERVLGDKDILTRRERRNAIVLFADLRGFTRLTVEHSPDDVMALLNNVFSGLMEIVYEQEGVIFDIAGDELMIAFNVPYDQPDANQRAVATALALQRTFKAIQARWDQKGMNVGMGIGISQGPVVIGHVGGRTRMNYAMVGEAVNVAHRMVEMAKDGHIIMTSDMMQDVEIALPPDAIEELPPQILKGLNAPLSVLSIRTG